MNKFTWLFLAAYADPKALPVVLRAQADTEEEARAHLAGDYSLTFAAKINTASPVSHHFYDMENETMWSVTGSCLSCDEIMEWGAGQEQKKESEEVKERDTILDGGDIQELNILLSQAGSLGEVTYNAVLNEELHETLGNLIGLQLDLIGKIQGKIEAAI